MNIFEIQTMQVCSLRKALRACKICGDPRPRSRGWGGHLMPPPPVSLGTKIAQSFRVKSFLFIYEGGGGNVIFIL